MLVADVIMEKVLCCSCHPVGEFEILRPKKKAQEAFDLVRVVKLYHVSIFYILRRVILILGG
jgi:hypothetical protein